MLKRFLILCFLPLLAGGLIYLFFRTDSPLADLVPLKYKYIPVEAWQKLLTGVLPDFLWSFSMANFLYSFSFLRKWKFFNWVVLLLLLLAEIIQLFTGTLFVFDYYDILAAILAFLFSFIVRNKFYENI